MERKVCFILDTGNRGWGEGGRLSKGQLPLSPAPPPDNQPTRAFIDGGRGLYVETAPSALTVILKLVIGGLTSVILIVLSTVSGSVCSHFLEASPQNCGSLCRGYSLVTM